MKTHQTNWSTNYFWRFLAQAWITENGNVVKKLKVTLKIRENTSNKFKLTYFWRVLSVWNHCAQRPPMQSTNSLRKSVTIDWTWKFWNVHIDAICFVGFDFFIVFSWKTFRLWVHPYLVLYILLIENTRLILFSVPILILTFKWFML